MNQRYMAKTKKQSDSEKLCDAIVEGMQDNKAKDIVILDLREIESAVCDFFVICSGESSTQVDGISDAITRFTRKSLKQKPWHIEGKLRVNGFFSITLMLSHMFFIKKQELFST